jgi:hypothetical protein
MSYPPPPSDPNGPNDPWATPPQGYPGGDPYTGGNPYAQPTYGGPPAGYGQPGAYGYPGYGTPYSPYGQTTNGKATAALWTGIGSLVLIFCCGAGIVGIVAVVLGAIARGEIKRSGGMQTGDGMAIAGIVMGAIAFVLGLVVLVLLVIGLVTDPATFSGVDHTTV